MALHREVLSHLEELKVVHEGTLIEILPVLGIDAEAWVSELLQDDFYSHVIGGVHSTLYSRLTYQLQKLKDKGITPVLMFSGVSPQSGISTISKKYKKAQQVWENIGKNATSEVEGLLAKMSVMNFENFREILKVSKENSAEVMVCPSLPGFQLECLEKVIGGVMGGLDLIGFGIEKIIIEVDFEHSSYRYVRSAEVLKALQINIKKFQECCIVRGLWLSKKCTKMSAVEVLQALKTKEITKIVPERYSVSIESALTLLSSPVFLHFNQPKLNFSQISGFANMITKKFHEKFYFALGFFPISPYLASAFIKKLEILPNPICDSLKYRSLVYKYKPLMRKVYSMLNSCFEEASLVKGIKVYYWYDELQPFQLDFEPVKHLNWDPVLSKLEELRKIEISGEIDLQYCINLHIKLWESDKNGLAELISSKTSPKLLSSDSLKLKLFLSLLENYGLISPTGTPTIFGKAITMMKTEFQYESFILLELLRNGLLDWKPMTMIWLPESLLKSAVPDKNDLIRMISRVSALIAPSLTGDVWTCEFDQDLSQFYSMVKYIARTYQYVQEALVLEELVKNSMKIDKSLINLVTTLAGQLPLHNYSVGIIVKKALNGVRLNEIKKEIGQVSDVEGDLEKAWIFWKDFVKLVKVLTAPNDEVREILADASKLFKTALISIGVHVI